MTSRNRRCQYNDDVPTIMSTAATHYPSQSVSISMRSTLINCARRYRNTGNYPLINSSPSRSNCPFSEKPSAHIWMKSVAIMWTLYSHKLLHWYCKSQHPAIYHLLPIHMFTSSPLTTLLSPTHFFHKLHLVFTELYISYRAVSLDQLFKRHLEMAFNSSQLKPLYIYTIRDCMITQMAFVTYQC